MKTYSLKKEEVQRNWFIVDATDRVLGRVATKIADKIRGKDKLKILKKVDFITKNYDEFSQIYQNFKDNNKIPLK